MAARRATDLCKGYFRRKGGWLSLTLDTGGEFPDAILIRWDKKAENYLGLLKLACSLLWFRRYDRFTRRT